MSESENVIHCPKCGLALTRNDRVPNKLLVALFVSRAKRYHCYICDYSFTVYPQILRRPSHQKKVSRPVSEIRGTEFESLDLADDSSSSIVDFLNQWGSLEKESNRKEEEAEEQDAQPTDEDEDDEPDTEEIDYRALIETPSKRPD